MTVDQHWLIVPEDAGSAMSLEHPHTCPRKPHRIRHKDSWVMGTQADCEEARLVAEFGLEHFFHVEGAPPDGYENPVRHEVRPGVYAVGLEDDPADADCKLNRLVVW